MQKPNPNLMMFRSQNPLLLLALLPVILIALVFVAFFILGSRVRGVRKKKSFFETTEVTQKQSDIEAEFRPISLSKL